MLLILNYNSNGIRPLKKIIRYEEELKDKVQRIENLILEDAPPKMKELIAEE